MRRHGAAWVATAVAAALGGVCLFVTNVLDAGIGIAIVALLLVPPPGIVVLSIGRKSQPWGALTPDGTRLILYRVDERFAELTR